MNQQFTVSVFSIEDSVVTDVVGLFPSREFAMSWINDQANEELRLNPSYERDGNEDMVMVCPPGDDTEEGFVYQIMELHAPATIVEEVLPDAV